MHTPETGTLERDVSTGLFVDPLSRSRGSSGHLARSSAMLCLLRQSLSLEAESTLAKDTCSFGLLLGWRPLLLRDMKLHRSRLEVQKKSVCLGCL